MAFVVDAATLHKAASDTRATKAESGWAANIRLSVNTHAPLLTVHM